MTMATGGALAGRVCVVTGATRGIGKGIALQLGEAGATVYITGRTLTASKDDKIGGSLSDTAKEIEARGGKCIPVQCDHSNDNDVEKLFDQVKREQNGRLDVLVNNAYSAVNSISRHMGVKFWEQPMDMWDTVNQVGLRNHYICSIYAARMMVPRKQGLIVFISSPGGLRYLFNIPYGVGKEAVDRMAADCAIEQRSCNVASISLWPGPVQTETIMHFIDDKDKGFGDPRVAKMFESGETIEYAGKAIVNLAKDQKLMQKSGKICLTGDLGHEYGFSDVDGRQHKSLRCLKAVLQSAPKTAWMAKFVPSFIYLPGWMLAMGGNKF